MHNSLESSLTILKHSSKFQEDLKHLSPTFCRFLTILHLEDWLQQLTVFKCLFVEIRDMNIIYKNRETVYSFAPGDTLLCGGILEHAKYSHMHVVPRKHFFQYFLVIMKRWYVELNLLKMQLWRNIYFKLSRNSEAFASQLLENVEEIYVFVFGFRC